MANSKHLIDSNGQPKTVSKHKINDQSMEKIEQMLNDITKDSEQVEAPEGFQSEALRSKAP